MRDQRLPQSRSTSARNDRPATTSKDHKKSHAIFSAVESLELRQMFAAPVLGGDGVLLVQGTTGNDRITVSKDPGAAEVRVVVNGSTYDYADGRVDVVKVDGGQGNDYIASSVSTGQPGAAMYFLGGAGSDTLVTATADDALYAGGENDVVMARAGHNVLNGGAGDDKLFGGTGNDTLVGELGNDQITDAGGSNSIVGVSRSDIVTTAPLPLTTPTAIGSTTPAPAPAPAPSAPAGTPAVPTSVVAASASASSIVISWRDNATNETGYKVERSTDGTTFYPVLGTGANGTRVTNSGLTTGRRYYYRVYAINGAGRSAYSPVVSAVPGTVPTPQPPLSNPPAPVPTTTGQPFVIGVWSQPHWSFDKWKARGINTVVGYESLSGTVSVEKFSQEAVNRGLFMIRHANADPRKDIGQKNLLAWMLNDEPDYHDTPHDQVINAYKRLKAADVNRPVFVNFSGASALWGYGNDNHDSYRKYLQGADWVGNDVYPITAHNRPSALNATGEAAQLLASLSGGKRQYAVLEASDQELPGRQLAYPGVNADQFRAQVFNSIISGVKGIIYFPQKIGGGFNFDAMNASVEAEMKKTNARVARIGNALMTQHNPSGVGMDVDGALRVTWRKFNGKTYFVVLNNSAQAVTASMDVRGVSATTATVDSENRTVAIRNGVVNDTFRPYEAHVYVVG